MADQAAVNGGTRVRIHSPFVEGVLGNVADFGSDIASLAELQAKLALIDLKESAGRAALPAGLIVASAALVLGSLPVGLLGLAELLVRAFSIERGWAYIATAAAITVCALILGLAGLASLRRSFESFRRSREELTRNVAWVKTVLAQSRRYTPAPRR
jgi:uncharacterized membrane protein YqjE